MKFVALMAMVAVVGYFVIFYFLFDANRRLVATTG